MKLTVLFVVHFFFLPRGAGSCPLGQAPDRGRAVRLSTSNGHRALAAPAGARSDRTSCSPGAHPRGVSLDLGSGQPRTRYGLRVHEGSCGVER